MYNWNLTAKTIVSVEEWKEFLNKLGIWVIIIGLYLSQKYLYEF